MHGRKFKKLATVHFFSWNYGLNLWLGTRQLKRNKLWKVYHFTGTSLLQHRIRHNKRLQKSDSQLPDWKNVKQWNHTTFTFTRLRNDQKRIEKNRRNQIPSLLRHHYVPNVQLTGSYPDTTEQNSPIKKAQHVEGSLVENSADNSRRNTMHYQKY